MSTWPASMRTLVVNWLLIGLALTSVVLVFATRSSVTTEELDARAKHVLKVFRKADITRVRFESANLNLEFVRAAPTPDPSVGDGSQDSNRWELVRPVQAEAEVAAVERYLSTLDFASYEREVNAPDRAALGLDAPRFVVHITMGDIEYRLRLGKPAPAPKGSAYLEVAGEGAPGKGVVIVRGSLIEELTPDPAAFRGRQLFLQAPENLQEIAFQSAGERRLLRRLSETEWRFAGGNAQLRVDRDGLERLFLLLTRLRAERFLPEDQAKVTPDMLKLELGASQEPKRSVLAIGGECPKSGGLRLVVRTQPDPVAACVASEVVAPLEMPDNSWVATRLFSYRADEVESFSVRSGERELNLARKDDSFVMRKPKEADLSRDVAEARLEALLGARGTVRRGADAVLPSGPETRIEVHSRTVHEGKATQQVVTLVTASDGSVVARRSSDGAVLDLGPGPLEFARVDGSLLRKLSVLDFDVGQIRRLKIHSEHVQQTLRQSAEGSWELSQPDGLTVDAGLASEAAELLADLSAVRWVSDTDEGSYGLTKPRVELTMQLGPPTEPESQWRSQVLRIGDATSGGYFAQVETDTGLAPGGSASGVFVVAPRVLEALTTWWIDRSVFMVTPAELSSIRLETAEAAVELVKRGESWVQQGKPSLEPRAVQGIVDTLGVLRAEAAVFVGHVRPFEGFTTPSLRVRVRYSERTQGRTHEQEWVVGAGDSWRGISVYYARVVGGNVSYVLPRSLVRQLIDPLR